MVTCQLEIVPIGGAFRSSVNVGGKRWSKNYPCVEDATREAEDLRMILPDMKKLLDASQSMPGYPQGGYKGEAEVDLSELRRRRFSLCSS